jgi:hypothetical protein
MRLAYETYVDLLVALDFAERDLALANDAYHLALKNADKYPTSLARLATLKAAKRERLSAYHFNCDVQDRFCAAANKAKMLNW